jgi:heme/copper-type cytochrome/quinol oxidase subunit 2
MHHTDGIFHSLTEPIFWIAAAICVIAELALLRSAFMPRRDAGESVPIPNSPRGAEMMWAVIPAVILALLLSATWRAMHH